jgi:hypothetical protein
MTSKKINLHKLLKLFGLQDRQLTSALRRELYGERKRLESGPGEGGDFHVPFWSDAKSHVIGKVDLISQTQVRVETSEQRKRLYPRLANGFLDWLEQTKRSTNESVGWREGNVHSHYPIPELELTLKVDNMLALQIGPDRYRLIYPYFTEKPVLIDQWARVGLWAMGEALPNHSLSNMEILDILRGRAFSGGSLFLKGDEEYLFSKRYREILGEWDDLRPEYGL